VEWATMWSYQEYLFTRDPSLKVVINRLAPNEDKLDLDFHIREGNLIEITQIEVKYRKLRQFLRWKIPSEPSIHITTDDCNAVTAESRL
jgi:hypothetical protein